jgi:hypothetical protein
MMSFKSYAKTIIHLTTEQYKVYNEFEQIKKKNQNPLFYDQCTVRMFFRMETHENLTELIKMKSS